MIKSLLSPLTFIITPSLTEHHIVNPQPDNFLKYFYPFPIMYESELSRILSSLFIISCSIIPPSSSTRPGFTCFSFKVKFRHNFLQTPCHCVLSQSKCSSFLFALTPANLWLQGKYFSLKFKRMGWIRKNAHLLRSVSR